MAIAPPSTAGNYLARAPGPGNGLVDVLDVILDKGLVIDAYVRVSAVGIELLTIDARIVIASVDTYLRFAEAVNRVDIQEQEAGLPDLLKGAGKSGAAQKAKGALGGAKGEAEEAAGSVADKIKEKLGKR